MHKDRALVTEPAGTIAPPMPLLQRLRDRLAPHLAAPREKGLAGVAFVSVQHLLGTAVTLMQTLTLLGADPRNMFVLGKCYSTHAEVARRLRDMGVHVRENQAPVHMGNFAKVFRRDVRELWNDFEQSVAGRPLTAVIVIDDGGHSLSRTPASSPLEWPAAGVELTTSGLRRPDLPRWLPIVQVASSIAKRRIEAPMISHAVVSKLNNVFRPAGGQSVCGVVGLGSIGVAVGQALQERGNKVLYYDRDPSRRTSTRGGDQCSDILDLLGRSDYVYGCTGEDIFKDVGSIERWLLTFRGAKTLISCSSGDYEFRSLLRRLHFRGYRPESPLATLKVDLARDRTLTIVRGGFPANFDASPESVPAADIQMTLALLVGGIAQARLCAVGMRSGEPNRLMLDPAIQRFVVEQWLALHPERRSWYPPELLDNFQDDEWIRVSSAGRAPTCETFKKIFA